MHECILGHQSLCVCEAGCWKRLFLAVGVCCYLQTFNSVVNMSVMGLVLGPSLRVISVMSILLCM